VDIIIPTRGRWDLALTCDRLPRELRKDIYIVCPSNEAHRHEDMRPWARVVVQQDDAMTIAAKRARIMRDWRGADRIVMLDDDLRFFVKREEDPKRLRTPTADEVVYWFRQLADMIGPAPQQYAHAGFGSRLFNNAKEPGWQHAKRMQYVLGYHLPTVRRECDLSGRIETREDMDYVLQLLRKGYPNAVCHTFVAEQSNEYAARGGCTGQRSTASSDADAELLSCLHPGLVRVVRKDYKGHPRNEVVIRWEAALREGQKREQDGSGGDQAGAEVRGSARVSRSSRRRRE